MCSSGRIIKSKSAPSLVNNNDLFLKQLEKDLIVNLKSASNMNVNLLSTVQMTPPQSMPASPVMDISRPTLLNNFAHKQQQQNLTTRLAQLDQLQAMVDAQYIPQPTFRPAFLPFPTSINNNVNVNNTVNMCIQNVMPRNIPNNVN
eukprot:Pgem_evm1s2058